MKRICMLFLILIAANAFGQKSVVKTPAPNSVTLSSPADTMQYIIGAFVAQWINKTGLVLNNTELFLKGMQDVFQNKPRIVPDSALAPRIDSFQKVIQKTVSQKMEQQLFLSLKDRPGVGVLPSGVRYMVLRTGKGAFPREKDTLVINMIAKLANGKVVEDTYQKKSPFVTTFAALFPGISDPLKLMTEGSQWQLFIPASLAYGEGQTELIPPYSALIIDVELVEVRPPKKV